LALYRIATIW